MTRLESSKGQPSGQQVEQRRNVGLQELGSGYKLNLEILSEVYA